MAKKKILMVVGTRPEVIKTAPVAAALRKSPGLRPVLVGTGQHRGLLDQMLRSFSLTLDENLGIMRAGQSPADVLAKGVSRFSASLKRHRPCVVLVQGDTTSALAGALAAFHLKIPVGHIEAGLRSGDFSHPFPEEMNRSVIDRIATLFFAPTAGNARTLLREGVPKERIFITGNTVVDSAKDLLKKNPPARAGAARAFIASPGRKILLTAHRRENFGAPLDAVFSAVSALARNFEDLSVLYPVHPNPTVRRAAARRLTHPRVLLCEPLDYWDFLQAAKAADVILSDSGGVQEEAPTLKTPVVVLRDVTERAELLRCGWGRLAGTDAKRIVRDASFYLQNGAQRGGKNPFGDGRAGPRIARIIARFAANL